MGGTFLSHCFHSKFSHISYDQLLQSFVKLSELYSWYKLRDSVLAYLVMSLQELPQKEYFANAFEAQCTLNNVLTSLLTPIMSLS